MRNNEFYQEYRKVGEQEYDISGYYDLGGMSYFSGNTTQRGYYISVNKVKRSNGIITTTIDFGAGRSGVKELLVPVNRKSKKAEDKAFNMINESKINELINYINR